MGSILLIKNADFSTNAVSIDDIYDLVKSGDTPTPHYPLTSSGWRFNSLPVSKKTTVYAVSITLPELSATSSPVPSKQLNSLCFVGVYNGSGSVSGVIQIQEIDISDIINAWIDGSVADGSRYIIRIPYPLILNPGHHFAICCGTKFGVYNRSFCYARVPDGTKGYLYSFDNSGEVMTTTYGMANDWYGFEED